VTNAYIKKESSQMKDPNGIKLNKVKISRREKITKIRAEINEIGMS
jgi:hypothetical protein